MYLNITSTVRLRDRLLNGLLQINDNPAKIAGGFALGTFVGVSPFVGLQLLIAIFISKFFRLNKAATVLGVLNSNWMKVLCIYPLNYKIGNFLLSSLIETHSPLIEIELSTQSILNSGGYAFVSILIGGLITGVFLSGIFYLISLKLIKKLRSKAEKKLAF
jgi:uncharacterized protein